jgi:predicted DNA-binding protein
MRKREREKIINSIRIDSETKQGQPISVRPFNDDYEKLDKIAEQTGEKKAAIVRRMIHFALNDKLQRFSTGRCQEKLDWLVRAGRFSETLNVAAKDNITEIRERVDRVEVELNSQAELLVVMRSLVFEIYAMSSVSISSLNLVLTKLIEFVSPDVNERKESVVVASTAMAELIDHAVSDLKKCLLFHEHVIEDAILDRSHLATKLNVLKDRIDSIPKTDIKEKSL